MARSKKNSDIMMGIRLRTNKHNNAKHNIKTSVILFFEKRVNHIKYHGPNMYVIACNYLWYYGT